MPPPPTPSSPSPRRRPSAIEHGLAVLLAGYDAAATAQRSPWDFALKRAACHAAGLTDADLRLLIVARWVVHGRAQAPGKRPRQDRVKGQRVRLGPESCFILTEAGVAVARAGVSALAAGPEAWGNGTALKGADGRSQEVPVWDAVERELRFRGQRVKRFQQPAPDQELVAVAFQEQDWALRIDDPLPPRAGQSSKARLRNTIKNLNRCQVHPLLIFGGDGTGTGIRWQLRHPSQGLDNALYDHEDRTSRSPRGFARPYDG